MNRGERKAIIQRDQPELSLSHQCRLLSISRSSFYYAPRGESPESLALMRRIDELFMKHPFYGPGAAARWSVSCGAKVSASAVTGFGA